MPALSGIPEDNVEGEDVCMRGDKHFFGHGVPRSYSQAFECYKWASELGYAPAMNSLASMYKNGQGVSRCITDAIQW
jgi:TPR repeat protein